MKILIAADGSVYSDAAIEMAARIAECGNGHEIVVVTVIEPAGTLEVEAMVESVDDLLNSENPLYLRAQEIGKASVEILKAKCKADCKIRYETLAGAAAQTIVEESERLKADLIVTGSHGYGLLKRALLGSVSHRIAAHAQCSVLIVRKTEN